MLEKGFSIVLCIVSIVIFYLSGTFDLSFVGSDGLGADIFPRVISVVLFILSAIIFFKSQKSEKGERMKYGLMMITMFGIYIFLISKIGYLVSTILFSFISISFFKKNGIVLRIVYSIVFPVGLYLLFTKVFNVSLPTGILI